MSGKPSTVQEVRQRVIAKSWNVLEYKLNQRKRDAITYKIAETIANKDMVAKQNIDMNANITKQDAAILSRYGLSYIDAKHNDSIDLAIKQ